MVRRYSPRGRRDEREGSHRITERRRIAGSHLDKPLAEKALHARTKIKLTPALSPRVILRMSDWAFLLERCRDDLSEIPFSPSSRLSAAARIVLLKSSFYVRRPADIGSTIIFASASQHINKTEHFISCFGAV
jgi:hypothetical protein